MAIKKDGDMPGGNRPAFVHIHLVSDATGETLIAVSRAGAAQYAGVRAIEHVHAMARTPHQIDQILSAVERAPGIVLYTLVNDTLGKRLEAGCRALGAPCHSVLDPVLRVFQSYLGPAGDHRIGAQHALDEDYFRRIDALNFTMAHDDGQHPEGLNDADVILVGVSRSSKTPTSIYLANRGVKAANVPIVPNTPLPPQLMEARRPLIVGFVASPERIEALRQNRLLALNAAASDLAYVDRAAIAEEVAFTRKLCARQGWPIIDVSRRSIEEAAAAVLTLHRARADARVEEVPVR